jgi:biopolymer transport protein ExbB
MRRLKFLALGQHRVLVRLMLGVVSALSLCLAPGAFAQSEGATAAAPEAQAQSAPAAEAPAAEAPAAEAAPEHATVKNPYGLDALWKAGDFVARGTLIALVIMSMGSWYIIVTKLFEQGKMLRQAEDARKKFWSAGTLQDGIRALPEGSPFRYIAESGTDATQRHEGDLGSKIDLHTWVSMAIQRAGENVQSRLQDGLAFLATVGSTAPFVGLFGTVWGIYHALTAIGIAGQASIDKVAGPVGEALIMTAIGLAVAVPAVLGYNWLVRRNKRAMEHLRGFAADLHSVLMVHGTPSGEATRVAAAAPTVARVR